MLRALHLGSRNSSKRKSRRDRQRRLRIEHLEARELLSRETLTLTDPSMWGISGQRDSMNPSISADGQLVVFASNSDNLVPNDNFAQINADYSSDAFVYNRASNQVSLVSVGPDDMSIGVGLSYGTSPIISPDGRYVLFQPGAPTALGPAGYYSIYLRDLASGTTALLTAGLDGAGANHWVYQPQFSADSHHVAFLSSATNLVSGATISQHKNLYVCDLETGTTTLATRSLFGAEGGNADTNAFAVSADGRFVVFESQASNLVSIDNSGIEQVYLRDLATGITTLVSVDPNGLASGMGHNKLNAGAQVLTADGRYVVFHSNATNLVPGGGTGSFLRDLRNGVTTLLSASALDGHAVNSNGSEVISPDGRFAAFATTESGVTAIPTDGHTTNVYVRNLQTGVLTMASANQAGTGGGNAGSGLGTFLEMPGGLSFSGSGQFLTFLSRASDLTPGVAGNGNINLFARDLLDNTTRLLTPNMAASDGGAGDAQPATMSFDGSVVAFSSTADDLVVGDRNRQEDVFLRDLKTEATTLVSLRTPLLPAAATSDNGALLADATPDGRYVVFQTLTYPPYEDLLPSQVFDDWGSWHTLLRDRQTGLLSAIDLAPDGHAVGGWNAKITPDGRYVAFVSSAPELLPAGMTSTGQQVYLRDRVAGTTTLVSTSPMGDASLNVGNDAEIAISDDGRYIAFNTWNPDGAIYLHDRGDLTTPASTVLVSHTPAGGLADRPSYDISISSDGRYVAFGSLASDLVANDTNNGSDIFRWDRTTGAVALVSVNAAGTGPGNDISGSGNPDAAPPVMSADGRYIAFSSEATDLAVVTSGWNVFVRDMGDGTTPPSTLLVSQNSKGEPANASSAGITMTPDGSMVSFRSQATNLVLDRNDILNDVFVRYLRGPKAGSIELVSANVAGETGSRASRGIGSWIWGNDRPVISDNGRYVVFASEADDLVPGFVDANTAEGEDIYVRDLVTGTTKFITDSLSGTTSSNVHQPENKLFISADGSTVIFGNEPDTTDLVAADRNFNSDVFAQTVPGRGAILGQVFNDRNANGMQDRTAGPGYALSFKPGDFVEVPNSSQLDLTGGATVSAWVKFDQVPSSMVYLVSQSYYGNSFDLVVDGDFRFIAGNGYTVQSNVSVEPGVWYHVAGTFDGGGRIAIVVNGVEKASRTITNFERKPTGAPLYIGMRADEANYLFSGTLDEVAVWNVAHSAAQIQADMGHALTGTEPGLAAYWSFNDGTARDVTGHGNDGVLGGGKVHSRPKYVSSSAPVAGAATTAMPESGLPYWTVFVDGNANGQLDFGEQYVLTDFDGGYALTGLPAGTYTVVAVPQTGWRQTAPLSSTARSVTIAADGNRVLHEDFAENFGLADLAVACASVGVAPAAAGVGQPLTITWITQNLGTVAAPGDWQDAVFLSTTPQIGPQSQLLVTVPHTGGLAAGEQYSGTATVNLPPVATGSYYVIVQTDRRTQVFEGEFGANRGNNVAATAAPIAVDLPVLTVGTPLADQFGGQGEDRYYQFTAEPGKTLTLALDSAAVTGSNELYVRRGTLPTRSDFDLAAADAGRPDQTLVIPATQAGTYYVLVHTEEGDANTSGFTLTATYPGFKILGIGLGAGGNAGPVTIPVFGSELSADTQVTLVSGSIAIAATAVDFRDPSLVYATFNLAGSLPGTYDVRLVRGTDSDLLSAAFSIRAARGPDLQVHLATPAGIRISNPVGMMEIEFSNDGDTDMPAPVFQMSADLGTLGVVSGDAALTGVPAGAIQFTAIGPNSPAGVLRAGDRGKISVRIQVPASVFAEEVPPQSVTVTLAWPATAPVPGVASAPAQESGGGGTSVHLQFFGAVDPNDLIGPAGYGAERWITGTQTLPYMVEFENDPKKANAAAQDVTVRLQLDPDLDWTTFQFGDIQFGSKVIHVPAGLQWYTTTVDTLNVDGTPLRVKVTASLCRTYGMPSWYFESIDPATGQTPTNPVAGFLPVNDATGRGLGFVHYSIRPKAGLATATPIDARAWVIFDTNSPIFTPSVLNTIDSGSPASAVSALPEVTNTPQFNVTWTGVDDASGIVGSGIAAYDVYVSTDGGPFSPWLSRTTQTSAVFTGTVGHRYGFYSVATDHVGRWEAVPAAADTQTLVSAARGDTIGVYVPDNSAFYLNDEQNGGDAEHVFVYGVANVGWMELVGDWNGDGQDTPGFYDPATAMFYLTDRLEGGDATYTFMFGIAGQGWKPLVGDWNADGKDSIAIYEPATSLFFFKNTLAGGDADEMVQFGVGSLGWLPIAGDWDGIASNGDGFGFYEPAISAFWLKNARTSGPAEECFQFGMGSLGWTVLAGNWDGLPGDGVGFYVPQTAQFFLKNAHTPGPADTTFTYGIGGAGWRPLVGSWQTSPAASPAPVAVGWPSQAAMDAAAIDQLDLAALAAQQLEASVDDNDLDLLFSGAGDRRGRNGGRR